MPVSLVNLGSGPDASGADSLYAAFVKVNAALVVGNTILPAMLGGNPGLIKLAGGSAFGLNPAGGLGAVSADMGALVASDISLVGRGGTLRTATLSALAAAIAPYLPVNKGVSVSAAGNFTAPVAAIILARGQSLIPRPVAAGLGSVSNVIAPSIVTTGLLYDFDPARATSLSLSGSNVLAWSDATGHVTFTPPGGRYATFVPNVQAGLPVLRGTGLYDVLNNSTTFSESFFVAGQSFTFEWVVKQTRTSASNGYGGLLNCNAASGTGSLQIETDSSVAEGVIRLHYDSGSGIASETGPITINVWRHMLLTYDGTNLTLYRDGAMVIQVAWPSGFAWTPGNTSGSRLFNGGYFDMLRFRTYNRAFSSADITQELAYMRGHYGF